jgi:hypothetical protein
MPGWRDFPALFRHMVVAVYNKSTSGGPDGVVKAMLITRDKLADWGYLYHRGGQEVLAGIRLTGKGWGREQKHLREGFAGNAKDLQFERLFKMIEPRLYELDGPGGTKPPKQPPPEQLERQDPERGMTDGDDKPKPPLPKIPRQR